MTAAMAAMFELTHIVLIPFAWDLNPFHAITITTSSPSRF